MSELTVSSTATGARPTAAALAAPAARLVAALTLAAVAGSLATDPETTLPTVAGALAYGLPGGLLVRRRPRNVVGWLALTIGALDALATLAWSASTEGLPGLWVSQWLWMPAYALVPTLLLLRFPDGRLPSARWRPVEHAALAGIALSTVGWALTPYGTGDTLDVPFPSGAENPVAAPDLAPVVGLAGAALLLACALGTLWSLRVRVRRSAGVERRQAQIVLLAALATAVLLAAAPLSGSEGAVASALIALATLPLPAGVAVAVLRHRLWELDVVVSRTLTWGGLSLAVVALYVAVVEAVGSTLLGTVVVALGTLPLHTRLQRAVNTLVYGDRDDPAAVLARLGDRLEQAVDLGDVSRTIAAALRLRYVAIAVDGVPWEQSEEDAPRPSLRLELVHGGEHIGTLLATPHDGDGARERRALEQLAPQVAALAHATRLQRELQRSRERLVLAREEERRRLRGDLHDELGPTLAILALELEAAADIARDDDARAALERFAGRARTTVDDVRRIVHDLRPPALDDLGLAEALREHVRTSRADGLRIAVDIPPLGRLHAAVEVAAYRIALEALHNVVRHSGARQAELVVRRTSRALEIAVRDDGRGAAGAPGHGGLGLRSMRERAAELGGHCTAGSRPGGGFEVQAVLPLQERP